MRNINLDNLPTKSHNNTIVIDWKSVDGEYVQFEYDGVVGEIQIFYSHSKRKHDYYIKCLYNEKEKIYPAFVIKQIKFGSLVKPHPNSMPPTQENWLYQRTDLHKFTDNPDDLKNYHLTSNKYYTFKCPSCGKKLRKCINSVEKNGVSCDLCSSSYSKNERLISSILTKMGEGYKSQKYFDGCIMTKPLPFDFYLPQYNMVIESHGAQHYKDIEYFGSHSDIVRADKIKKDYCFKNNIKYCEIDCSSGKSIDVINHLKNFLDIKLSKVELKECMWESMHNISEIDNETAKNLYDCFWNFREIGEYMGDISSNRVKSVLIESGVEMREENFSFWASCVDIVSGEIYGNLTDVFKKEYPEKTERFVRYYMKDGKPISHNNKTLCIVYRKDLLLDADKSHLKKVYKEAMKQLKENKPNPFDKYIGCNVDSLIEESDNQRELMLHLDNLPQEYQIENGVVIKKY